MIIIISLFIAIASVFLGKYIFGRLFNHISLYVFAWLPIIVLFQLKLIRYQELSTEVWLLILFAYLSFLLGTLTIYAGRKLNGSSNEYNVKYNWSVDNGRTIRLLVLVFGIIGLLAVIQNWIALLYKFGTIQNVLLNESL
ncbi:MAG: hypothetical protein RBR74_09690, partial [Ignavibacteriaceae bacterium]|nr:hypothetical protein [Ignavibacteriaceae bacterium]